MDLLGALAEAFQREPTKALVQAYWLALKDLPIDAVEHGAFGALRECRFMPKPVEIRERIHGADAGLIAEGAWSCLLGAIRATAGADITFEDGAIGRIVERMGGWEYVSGLESEELLKWTRQEFLRLYASDLRHGADHSPHTVHGWLASGSPHGCQDRSLVGAPHLRGLDGGEEVPRVDG